MSARLLPSAGDEEGYKDTPSVSEKEAEEMVLLCRALRGAAAGVPSIEMWHVIHVHRCACDTHNTTSNLL